MSPTSKLLFGGLAVLVAVALLFVTSPKPTAMKTTILAIGSTTVVADVADTDAARVRGLSGRSDLPDGKGMLFVFNQRGDWGIWMKDMQFPIDILFVSETSNPNELSVVSVEKDVSPDTYKQNPPQVFYPPLAVRYVLELPAGYAAAHDIGPGTKIVLQ